MSYLHHIDRCNTYDLSGFRPFLVDGKAVGWVRHALASKLTRFPAIFRLEHAAVCIHPDRTDPEDRSAAVGRALAELAADGEMEPLRDELYPVKTDWHGPELFRLDRAAAPLFGLRAWGVHATGYVRDADGGYRLWIGRRAPDKLVSPDKASSLKSETKVFPGDRICVSPFLEVDHGQELFVRPSGSDTRRDRGWCVMSCGGTALRGQSQHQRSDCAESCGNWFRGSRASGPTAWRWEVGALRGDPGQLGG